MPQPSRNNQPKLSYSQMSRLGRAKAREFSLQSLFKYGYRNKEDISNLPPETLVLGSQNVLTNAAELVAIRQGYALDGPAGNQNSYGIDSAYDFQSRTGAIQNLRKWGQTLEVRYVNPNTSAVSWVSLLSNLDATKKCNFTNFFDLSTEVSMFCLFVNGGNSVYEWTGGVASVASVSASITGIISAVTTTPIAGGISYGIGDVLTLGGGTGGKVTVTATDYTGAVTAVTLTSAGSGYTATTETTTAVNSGGTPSSGTGCTIAVSSVASGVSITIQGTSTIPQLGFYNNGSDSAKFILLINGVQYTYTGVAGQIFYGVSPDPTGAGIAAGDAVIQLPFATKASGITGIGSTFEFDLIATLENQVWYGAFNSTNVYVSKTNNYKNVQFSSPRLPAEGALITLDAPPTAFSPQASNMYISAGRDQWWISEKNALTVTETVAGNAIPIATETLYATRLKTAHNQGAQNQGVVGRFKNSIVYVSNEQIINALGLVKDIYADPQVTNLSDPIKYDVDAYDFTGAQIAYDNYYIYVLIPKQGIVRMYNVQKQYWEAPQTIPISRVYHVTAVTGSTLYGHSSITNESYKLFTGYNDNGNPINSVIAFPYVSSLGGSPWEKKNFNKIYTEGYVASNTSVILTINYDFGAFSGSYTTVINGANAKIIFNKITDGSIGRNSLGSEPEGSILNVFYPAANPKFRIINTMPRVDCYEYQLVFSTDDVDFQYAILRTGPAVTPSSNLPIEISI